MFIADLHIHSRFSRATSKSLDLPNLDLWAGRKGIHVVGTGDITHPGWLDELEEQLEEAEEGLYRLKSEYALENGGQARFILSGEISNIYKKDGKVRKVHNVVLMPSLETARALSNKLDAIGNVRSDGRPILGLDSKDLLSICLDVSPESFFIPAHIWTPWFSLLGSKSGFDAIEECFEDLTGHIKALETGLSSHPPMNWRLSGLDGYVLVSNSDAHSPDKLGRESNLFECPMNYPDMVKAMSGLGGFGGTIEFFPEEGKYHLDGHRKCDVRLEPEETRALKGLCPVCGKPLTVGVYNRVLELADRPKGEKPDGAYPFYSLIPLTEVLSEIIGVGPKSKKVQGVYHELLNALGPELFIIREAPLVDVAKAGGDLLAEALKRMRESRVRPQGGYDGEYGIIRVFEPGELDQLCGQSALFSMAPPRKKKKIKIEPVCESAPPIPEPVQVPEDAPVLVQNDPLLDDLNTGQRLAVSAGPGQVCIVAGPGTGKTTVLTRRAAWLVREGLASPEEILAVTFTRQAAGEMASRLAGCLPFRVDLKSVRVMTFHALGRLILTEATGGGPEILDEDARREAVKTAASESPYKPGELESKISLAKQGLGGPDDEADPEFAACWRAYERQLALRNGLDFDDLVRRAYFALQSDPELLAKWQSRFKWFLIDEYQDVNLAQYSLAGLLAHGDAPNLTVIGDPDQAIYGFRGADSRYFGRFSADYPEALRIGLDRNYRSTEAILKASGQVIRNNPGDGRVELLANRKGPARITMAEMVTPAAEAEYIVRRIEGLLGGSGFYALDSGRADGNGRDGSELSLGDIAILYRLHALAPPLMEALDRAGLPYQHSGDEPVRETDGMDFGVEKINLLTMHAAKGLEFEVVFVAGAESGILPYRPPNKAPADKMEERRLFFVAMTRAKRRLFLTHCRNRTLYGKKRRPNPSPFLLEIEKNLKLMDSLPPKQAQPKTRQMGLF